MLEIVTLAAVVQCWNATILSQHPQDEKELTEVSYLGQDQPDLPLLPKAGDGASRSEALSLLKG